MKWEKKAHLVDIVNDIDQMRFFFKQIPFIQYNLTKDYMP